MLLPAVHGDKPGGLMSAKSTSRACSAGLTGRCFRPRSLGDLLRNRVQSCVLAIGSYDVSAKLAKEVPQLIDGRWMLTGGWADGESVHSACEVAKIEKARSRGPSSLSLERLIFPWTSV